MARIRYAQVGLGDRSRMFSEAVVERFVDTTNRSLASGGPVRVDALIDGLEMPDYMPMPGPYDPIDPMPMKRSAAVRV